MALTLVQVALSADSLTIWPFTATFGSPVTPGNLIVVLYGVQNMNAGNTGTNQPNVTDSLGNGPSGTYSMARDDSGPGGFGTFQWAGLHYANNVNGGSDTVSVNSGSTSPGPGGGWCMGLEISDQDTASPIDTTGNAASGSDASPTVNLTTANVNAMILAIIQQSFFGSGESVGSGFTLIHDFTGSSGLGELKIAPSAGTNVANGVLGSSNDWLASAIAIKPAAQANASNALFYGSD